MIATFILTGCGKPEGITDEDYEKYMELSAPKILYRCSKLNTKQQINFGHCIQDPTSNLCTDELVVESSTVGYVAGIGAFVTYNKLLGDIENECKGEHMRLEILESSK